MSESTDQPTPVRIRRVPKFSVFIVLGAALGEIVTIIVTASFPVDPSVGFGPLLGYFSLYGLTAGVILGSLVALVLDRVLARRAKTLSASVERGVERADAPVETDDPIS